MASEMTTYAMHGHHATFWDLYESAAKYMYGDNIEVVRAPWVFEQLDNISFTITVEAVDQQVMEKTKTTVDITTKEYTNRSTKEVDETLVRVTKNYSTSKESQYQFFPTDGVNWGMGGNIGAKVMGLSMSGGSTTVGGYHNRHKSSKQAFHADFHFNYEQEEKIKVPPLSYMKATVVSYVIKYEQGYTLRFSLPAYYRLPVMYKTCYNRICCSNNTGFITATQLLQTLPDFREEYGTASFVQHGILSWMGEGSSVNKEVRLLHDRVPLRAGAGAGAGKIDLNMEPIPDGRQKLDLAADASDTAM